ncbi:hypothetical protein PORY_001017 [Pneumocystis oryctolagi]|uniref:Uncharacterized protein n=1 Tax=Pneumocystis oryctolagi TaxID=42067 RepID=A0ACB7CCI5_9ASCO|nr:hypothetical protein PORY_001017 [Pneumocystis oryctolagi]
MKEDYKLQKEAFVTGHTGQPFREIFMIGVLIVVTRLLSACFQSRYPSQSYRIFHFFIDYGFYYIIPLLFVTIFASHLEWLALGLLVSVFILKLCKKPYKTDKQAEYSKKKLSKGSLKNIGYIENTELKSYVTVFRASIMLITCLSILAVDFKIFPRKFAKVETWGISLMDFGVGFFVFSSGIVAIRSIKNNYSDKTTSFIRRIFVSLKQSYMFFIVGFIRILITKISDYPEHITEYGVHWNFFFTLGFLSLSLVFIEFLRRYLKSYLIIIILLSIYNESLIRSSRILAYILDAPRTNLISANKEGIFSLTVGINTGEDIFYGSLSLKTKKSKTINNQYKIILKTFLLAVFYFSIYCYLTFYKQRPASRRLTNLPYVSIVSAGSCSILACHMLTEILFFKFSAKYIDTVPLLLHYVNKNGLIVFLIANVITGLVNSSINTLEINNAIGFLIMTIYGIIICGVSFIIDIKKWIFKF